ncbi:bromodomain-containing protein [Anaeramoeba flamelloides]|uniref:Bromodomain-containing protein n=1 Tax=Anaeramoeba flamelloides TaxID=1746091 RepID=A0AAV7YW41_9EUKA|nr:bromodomain-containing protein [Anaeramoeba flamelloides]
MSHRKSKSRRTRTQRTNPVREIWSKELIDMIDLVSTQSHAKPFLKPVDWKELELPTYPEIIKNPMDLGTIKKKLQARQYSTKDEVISDFELMINNAKTFNFEIGDPIHIMALKLHNDFLHRYIKAERTIKERIRKLNNLRKQKAKSQQGQNKSKNKNKNKNRARSQNMSSKASLNTKDTLRRNQLRTKQGRFKRAKGSETDIMGLSKELVEMEKKYQQMQNKYQEKINKLENKAEQLMKKVDHNLLGTKLLSLENKRIKKSPDLGIKSLSSNLLGLLSGFTGGPLQLDRKRKMQLGFYKQSRQRKLDLNSNPNFPFGFYPFYSESPYSVAPLVSFEMPFKILNEDPQNQSYSNYKTLNNREIRSLESGEATIIQQNNDLNQQQQQQNQVSEKNSIPKISYEEKYHLSKDIETLEDEGKFQVFKIIRDRIPNFNKDSSKKVAIIGFDELDDQTLLLIKKKVREWKRNKEFENYDGKI